MVVGETKFRYSYRVGSWCGLNSWRLRVASPKMKNRRMILVLTVAVTLLALPYVILYFKPSANQFICAFSNRLVGNDRHSLEQRMAPEQAMEAPEQIVEAPEQIVEAPEQVEAPKQVEAIRSWDDGLSSLIARAATKDKTVIITTLNQAWAANNTMIDVFLDSFHRGENTQQLLNHLVIVALDQRSYDRCQELHRHCFMLETEGVDFSGNKGFMSKDFLKMMWRRMTFLRTLLEMGYNFVFTDADIIWFRNPFDHFAKDADFQISCDRFKGNPYSLSNKPNCGYQYARSNKRTIAMYRRWCKSGEQDPSIDEQTQLNKMIKQKELSTFKVKLRFLETERFSGFCQKSKDMSKVVTMHANCCTGLDNKIQDLRRALDDWGARKTLSPQSKADIAVWRVPASCRHSKWPSPPGKSPTGTVTVLG